MPVWQNWANPTAETGETVIAIGSPLGNLRIRSIVGVAEATGRFLKR